MEFKRKFEFPALVSVSCRPKSTAVVKYQKKESKPNIPVFGVDENYVDLNGFSVENGRNFSALELSTSAHTVVLGNEIAKEIFDQADPIDKVILVSNIQFRVIGVLKEKGSSFGFGGDRNVLMPLPTARQFFGYANMGYTLAVMANSPDQLDLAINESTGIFRSIRHDRPGKPDSFTITRSDSLSQGLIENLDYVSIAATIIAFITLLGAAIGLMNIMLVSVTERTREIGIRKALGATTESIKYQFLTEAVMVCQFGGLLGIIVGIAIGNLVGNALDVAFIIPWNWIIVSVVVTFVVGIAAGFYPAQKAAQFDPIESLRYE
jgi:putative ABC transport system permease protein